VDVASVAAVLSTSIHVVIGWTCLSAAAAAVWCMYRSPGRAERLAGEVHLETLDIHSNHAELIRRNHR
jgi:hypothetical protein